MSEEFFPPQRSPVEHKIDLLLRGQQTILAVLGQLVIGSGQDAAKIAGIDAQINQHTKELQAALDAAAKGT